MSARRPPPKHAGPRIAALGGGTGLPAVLRALRIVVGPSAPADAITAIVAVPADGGSSGQLRHELQVLPPGDIRNCVAALADDTSPLTPLLQHRFPGGSTLSGHPIGNLLLAALTQQADGDFAAAVEQLGRIAGINGRVLPATADDVHLKAEYTSGEVVVGETAIASRHLPIRWLTLQRHVRPLPDAIAAIVNADAIIVGPGSLFTSILPVLLVDGIAPTIYGLTVPRIYVANLMTEPGETDGFTLDDHLAVIRQHTGCDLFDYVLVNRRPLATDLVARYRANGSVPVNGYERLANAGGARLVECDLAADDAGGKIRHEPVSLATALRAVLPQQAAATRQAIA